MCKLRINDETGLPMCEYKLRGCLPSSLHTKYFTVLIWCFFFLVSRLLFNRLQQTTNIWLADDRHPFCAVWNWNRDFLNVFCPAKNYDDWASLCKASVLKTILQEFRKRIQNDFRDIFLRLQVIDLFCLQYSHIFSSSLSSLSFSLYIDLHYPLHNFFMSLRCGCRREKLSKRDDVKLI